MQHDTQDCSVLLRLPSIRLMSVMLVIRTTCFSTDRQLIIGADPVGARIPQKFGCGALNCSDPNENFIEINVYQQNGHQERLSVSLENVPNLPVAGALPRTPLGELTALLHQTTYLVGRGTSPPQ